MNLNSTSILPRKTVLVLGGRGFIGRNVVSQLQRAGATVIIGSRCKFKPRAVGVRRIRLHEKQTDLQIKEKLRGIDVVINTVGILRQRIGETYNDVHHQAVARWSRVCSENNIRFIHVSALGLNNNVSSEFLHSKLRGEEAVKRSGGDWFIVRPSLVDGLGGYGAKWFRRIANWPIHFLPANAHGVIAPIDIKDLGKAIRHLALDLSSPIENEQRIFELCGPERFTLKEYLVTLGGGDKARWTFNVPALIARALSHICDLFFITPYSFGHYELLKYDNCSDVNRLGELLGRPSKRIGSVVELINFGVDQEEKNAS